MKKFALPLLFFLSILAWKSQAQWTWTTREPMPTTRYGLSASVVDGVIYVIGGATAYGNSVATVEAYDPDLGYWETKTPMPTARVFLSTVVIDDKIYALGGVDGEGQGFNTMVRTIEVYDPATDVWETKTDMPIAVSLFSASVVDGTIYIVGGADFSAWPGTPSIVGDVWAYEPNSENWEQKPSMSTPRALHTTCVLDDEIYAIGGASLWGGAPLQSVEVYNPGENSWSHLSDMPEARFMLASSIAAGSIFVTGGAGTDFSATRTNLEYDPNQPTTPGWAYQSLMPTARHSLANAKVDEFIYAIGGRTAVGSSGVGTVEAFEVMVGVPSEKDGHPGELMLYQNYPNPFSSAATIEFSLPVSDFVNLKVFDTGGKEVATLVSGEYSAGLHQCHWEAEGLENGVYFYQLKMGAYSTVKKMVLLK